MSWGSELERAYKLDEGRRAYEKRKESGVKPTNPYEAGTEDHRLWEEGYHATSWQDTMGW